MSSYCYCVLVKYIPIIVSIILTPFVNPPAKIYPGIATDPSCVISIISTFALLPIDKLLAVLPKPVPLLSICQIVPLLSKIEVASHAVFSLIQLHDLYLYYLYKHQAYTQDCLFQYQHYLIMLLFLIHSTTTCMLLYYLILFPLIYIMMYY